MTGDWPIDASKVGMIPGNGIKKLSSGYKIACDATPIFTMPYQCSREADRFDRPVHAADEMHLAS